MTDSEAAWLAGILEGEGCFDFNQNSNRFPRIRIEMIDRDIIERVQKLCGGGGTIRETNRSNRNHSTTYKFQVASREKVKFVLEQISPWMSQRRLSKIKQLQETL